METALNKYWVVMLEVYEEREELPIGCGRFRVVDYKPIKVALDYKEAFRFIKNYDMDRFLPSKEVFLYDTLEPIKRSIGLHFENFNVVYSLLLYYLKEES